MGATALVLAPLPQRWLPPTTIRATALLDKPPRASPAAFKKPQADDVFRQYDRNRDGLLTRAEAEAFIRSTDLETELRRLDRNRDGVVTRSEWRGNNRSFELKDRNNDGVLSGTELR